MIIFGPKRSYFLEIVKMLLHFSKIRLLNIPYIHVFVSECKNARNFRKKKYKKRFESSLRAFVTSTLPVVDM